MENLSTGLGIVKLSFFIAFAVVAFMAIKQPTRIHTNGSSDAASMKTSETRAAGGVVIAAGATGEFSPRYKGITKES